jgi:large subunit ribosomal protein L25
MTTETVRLEAEPRQVLGKKVAQLRRQGIIPIHLYGPGEESRSLQCPAQRLIQVLSLAGTNAPIAVSIRGEPGEKLAFAREIQWDPRRDSILHVDLLTAEASRPVTAQTPVVLTGESPGARSSGGTVMLQSPQLEVLALPLEIPAQVEVDLGLLTSPDGVVKAGDVPLPPTVQLAGDPEAVVVRIGPPPAPEAPGDSQEPAEA